jgi:hypothetical protein
MPIDMVSVASVFGPYLVQLLAVLISMGLGWILKQLSVWLGFQITESQWKVIHGTAEAAAGRIWAAASPEIAGMSITPHSPVVTAAANDAIRAISDVLDKLGITPDGEAAFIQNTMAPLIAAKLGALQARAAAGPAAPTPSMKPNYT